MRFENMTSPEIGALDRDKTVLLLPLGAVEQHGNHMPVGTDSMIAHALCLAVAGRREETVVLPPPWYGLSAHHMSFPGSITLSASTVMAVVSDIVRSVAGHGFRRVVVLNGHGGNGGLVDVLSSTLGHEFYGSARIAGVTYFQLARGRIDSIRTSKSGGTGHAGEFETSVMMHLAEAIVHIDRASVIYPDTGTSYLNTDLTSGSVVRSYFDFGDLSPSGTFGDPSHASKEKGEAFFNACVEEVAAFVADFAKWPIGGETQ